MRVLVTGSGGFIGKNLVVRLGEQAGTEVLQFVRGDTLDTLSALIAQADAVVHLAGENRPRDVADFARINTDLTKTLCDAIRKTGRTIPLILSSSTQAEMDNPYGQSKRAAEQVVERFAGETGNPVVIYRLPGVFGKWCKPNYNSVVATFCHNIANDLPIQINDPAAQVRLVYVDDVVNEFLHALANMSAGVKETLNKSTIVIPAKAGIQLNQAPGPRLSPGRRLVQGLLKRGMVEPEYTITLGDLAAQIQAFKNCRTHLVSERVGTGLTRALYSTYVSYLPTSKFAYDLPRYGDERGVFVEMLKTPDCGQFSYFTAHPGITRGGHYHHSKTEKFLVIKGTARFGFRHVVTNETYELVTSGDKPQVVETVPGWTHDITNVGDDEMVVMLWANEIFDRERPDTIACKV